MIKKICSLLFLFTLSSSSNAFTANQLLEFCQAEEYQSKYKGNDIDVSEAYKGGLCTGFINGFNQSNAAFGTIYRLEKGPLCLPKGMKISQQSKVLIKFLENNPDKLHWNAGTLFFAAMREAFPCN